MVTVIRPSPLRDLIVANRDAQLPSWRARAASLDHDFVGYVGAEEIALVSHGNRKRTPILVLAADVASVKTKAKYCRSARLTHLLSARFHGHLYPLVFNYPNAQLIR